MNVINGKGIYFFYKRVYYIRCIAKIDAEKSGMKKKNAFF